MDFQSDETSDGRRLKLAHVIGEFTSESLAMRVSRSCTTDQFVVEVIVMTDGRTWCTRAPEDGRKSPEMVAWVIREWCRLSGTRST